MTLKIMTGTATLSIMPFSIAINSIIKFSIIVNKTYKPFMLNVAMLIVVAPNDTQRNKTQLDCKYMTLTTTLCRVSFYA
jgi:hypothetical protein